MIVNGKVIYKFKTENKSNDSPTQSFLGGISNKFSYIESKELCLKGIVYDFSADCIAIAVDDILNIHKYLMKKNGIV